MDVQALSDFVTNHTGWTIVAGVVTIFIATAAFQKFGFYTCYFIAVLLALVGSLLIDNVLYFYAFFLGTATAFAEIIGKFSDEPIKSLRTPHALFYHLLNGAIAAFALKVLFVYGVAHESELDKLKVVVTAGLGSMLIMRSKLFNIKVGGEDISFGPEQIIKVFFQFMEAAIDRVRAQSRVDFVKLKLGNINFAAVDQYSLTMLQAAQALAGPSRSECEEAIVKLRDGNPTEPQLKSYRLGFLLLNTMGEDFVSRLFDKAPPEWQIRAPIQEKQDQGLRLPFLGTKPQLSPYFAYGSSMCSRKFRDRLGWSDIDETKFREATSPTTGVVKGQRLVFTRVISDGPPHGGLANIVPDPDGTVEGVIYQLSKEQIEYLDKTEAGYARMQVTAATADGKNVDAQAYVAESTGEVLQPDAEYFDLVLQGAKEYQLSPEYIQQIESSARAGSRGGGLGAGA